MFITIISVFRYITNVNVTFVWRYQGNRIVQTLN